MANFLYDKAREGFLGGTLSWSADTIKAVLVDTAVAAVPAVGATDPVLSNIAAGVISTSGAFANKTITSGVADADDVTFTAVTGATVEALVIYKDTGVATTSRLIAAFDTATGLTLTPNGADVQAKWDAGANKIFKL